MRRCRTPRMPVAGQLAVVLPLFEYAKYRTLHSGFWLVCWMPFLVILVVQEIGCILSRALDTCRDPPRGESLGIALAFCPV